MNGDPEMAFIVMKLYLIKTWLITIKNSWKVSLKTMDSCTSDKPLKHFYVLLTLFSAESLSYYSINKPLLLVAHIVQSK